MKDNDKKMLFGIGIVFLFLATVGFSYAYFSNAIANKDVKDQVVETGTLKLIYTDGPQIIMNNIKPGDTVTKTVYVANTGTLDAVYNLIWQELTNEITNDEMLIKGTCTRMNSTTEAEEGTCEGVDNTPITSNNIKRIINIEPNIIHKYDLTITFKNIDVDQNYNQGKKFSGVLGVKESTQFEKDSWTTIATNVKNGNISNYNLGDTKEVDLGDLGKHNVRIANTTTPEECSTEGFSQTACGFVLEFEDIIAKHVMNESNRTTGGWPASDMYVYVNTDIYNMFPIDLRSFIIDTTVVSGRGSVTENNFISSDKLYLLSPKEIYGNFNSFNDAARSLTRQFDYYKSIGVTTSKHTGAAKKYGTVAERWWLRTALATDSFKFLRIISTGGWNSDSAGYSYGVSPAFRIG